MITLLYTTDETTSHLFWQYHSVSIYMVYCYKILIESLQMLLLRPHFFLKTARNEEKELVHQDDIVIYMIAKYSMNSRLTMAIHFYLSPTISCST